MNGVFKAENKFSALRKERCNSRDRLPLDDLLNFFDQQSGSWAEAETSQAHDAGLGLHRWRGEWDYQPVKKFLFSGQLRELH